MHIQRAHTPAQFDALADDWNRLCADVPFRRWEWNRAWWRQYGQGHELFILCVYDVAGALIGIAPWYLEQTPGAGRVIRFLGSGEACSEYATIMIAPAHEAAVCDAIVEWLSRAECSGADHVSDNQWDQIGRAHV